MVSANWLLLLFVSAVHYRAAECSAIQQEPRFGDAEIIPHGGPNKTLGAEEPPPIAEKPEGTDDTEKIEVSERDLTPRFKGFKLPGWLKILLKWFTKDKTCIDIKKKGGTPQSKHSPLKFFGYLSFDTVTRVYTITPGFTLSTVNGYPVPIQVGTRDYILQGSPESIILFMECFAEYKIRGSYLGDDGHWHTDPQTNFPLFMQVENVGPGAFESVRGLILQHSLEILLSAISPEDAFFKAVSGAVETIEGSSSVVKSTVGKVTQNWSFASALGDLASYLCTSLSDAKALWDTLADIKSKTERIKTFTTALLEQRKKSFRTGNWVGEDNIDVKRKLTVTITMYPRPENGVRATFKLGSNVSSVEDLLPPFLNLLKSRKRIISQQLQRPPKPRR